MVANGMWWVVWSGLVVVNIGAENAVQESVLKVPFMNPVSSTYV